MTKRLFLTFFALLAAVSGALAQGEQFKVISAEQMKALIDRGERVTVVDARTEQEYAQGHIPAAINVGPDKYPYIAGFLPRDKGTLLIFYCRGYN